MNDSYKHINHWSIILETLIVRASLCGPCWGDHVDITRRFWWNRCFRCVQKHNAWVVIECGLFFCNHNCMMIMIRVSTIRHMWQYQWFFIFRNDVWSMTISSYIHHPMILLTNQCKGMIQRVTLINWGPNIPFCSANGGFMVQKTCFFGAVGSVDVWKLIETGEKLTFCADLVLSTSHGVRTSWNSTHQHEHDQICWMHLWYTFICWTHPQLAGGFTDGYGDCWVNMLSHSQYRVVQRWVYRYTPNPMTCFFLECSILRVSMTNIFFAFCPPILTTTRGFSKMRRAGGALEIRQFTSSCPSGEVERETIQSLIHPRLLKSFERY